MNRPVFSARLAVLLVALAVFLFSLSVLLSAYDDPAAGSSARAGAGAHSISSLGYAGLFDLLEQLGWRVERPGDPGGGDGVLVVAEPGDGASLQTYRKLADLPGRALIVLPKWKAVRDPRRSRWIMGVDPLPVSEAQELLSLVAPKARVRRGSWPREWRDNELGFAPVGPGAAQLIVSDDLRPIVAADDSSILVGELKRKGKTVWVLSDPDVMANHGIGSGDNAAFMVDLLDALRGGKDVPVVFDEGVHGYGARRSSPLRLLFGFPFVVATILAFLSALLLVLAGAERFGRPERTAPRLGFGKEGLIDSGARLMAYAGHEAAVLRRYVAMNVDAVADAFHAPPGLDEAARAAWLDRAVGARARESSCADILRRVHAIDPGTEDLSGLMDCADEMHRWREAALSTRPPGH